MFKWLVLLSSLFCVAETSKVLLTNDWFYFYGGKLMKFWKRIAVAGMATIAALSLAACGSKSSSSSTSTSNSYTPKSLNIQFVP